MAGTNRPPTIVSVDVTPRTATPGQQMITITAEVTDDVEVSSVSALMTNCCPHETLVDLAPGPDDTWTGQGFFPHDELGCGRGASVSVTAVDSDGAATTAYAGHVDFDEHAHAVLAVSRPLVRFGRTSRGEVRFRQFVISNRGTDVTTAQLPAMGKRFRIQGAHRRPVLIELAPGETHTVRVRYRSFTPGFYSRGLRITRVDGEQRRLRVQLDAVTGARRPSAEIAATTGATTPRSAALSCR